MFNIFHHFCINDVLNVGRTWSNQCLLRLQTHLLIGFWVGCSSTRGGYLYSTPVFSLCSVSCRLCLAIAKYATKYANVTNHTAAGWLDHPHYAPQMLAPVDVKTSNTARNHGTRGSCTKIQGISRESQKTKPRTGLCSPEDDTNISDICNYLYIRIAPMISNVFVYR